jgi:hypothetical protein
MKKIKTALLLTFLMISLNLSFAQRRGGPLPSCSNGKGCGGKVSCTAGGPGSTSCSLTVSTSAAGFSASETVSTSCGSGYYACCSQNSFGTAATAKCIKN